MQKTSKNSKYNHEKSNLILLGCLSISLAIAKEKSSRFLPSILAELKKQGKFLKIDSVAVNPSSSSMLDDAMTKDLSDSLVFKISGPISFTSDFLYGGVWRKPAIEWGKDGFQASSRKHSKKIEFQLRIDIFNWPRGKLLAHFRYVSLPYLIGPR